MQYIKLDPIYFPNFFNYIKNNPHPCYFNITPRDDDKIVVAKGIFDSIQDLPDRFIVIDTKHQGGTICGFKDFICLVGFDRIKPNWMENLTNYLKSKNLNVKNCGNDILVDEYKVAGFCATPMNKDGLVYYTFFVSLYVDLNDILLVCNKPMKKIPKGLNDYGITRKEILDTLQINNEVN